MHGTHRPLSLLAIVATIALVMSGTAYAVPLVAGPLVPVTNQSPLAGCTADDAASQSGTNYPNSEVEPWIDANPTNPANLVGVYQQDRWSNGGARGLLASVTHDGGASWTTSAIPGITACEGGVYQRATDPWVSFGPDGRLYQLSLSFNERDFDHALLASYSTNGGISWSTPATVRRDTDANAFNDKQSITADALVPGYVYAVWDRLLFPPTERASVIAGFNSFAYRGPTWFARSTDGGQTWEEARPIFDPGQQSQTIANQIVVLPSGVLMDFFALGAQRGIAAPRHGARATLDQFSVAFITSSDKGVTWSAPTVIDRIRTIGVTDPESGADVRTGDIIPDVAVDRTTGALYAVWQDARFNGFGADAIAFAMSTDGGRSWSSPIKVNKTPTSIAIGNQQAFTASVAVAATGAVAVTYYDFRNNASSDGALTTDYWIAHCHSACTDPESWSESRVTDAAFDMLRAPNAFGYFTGDYEGLTSIGSGFATFFSAPQGADPGNTYFRIFH
jgi:hypothetical protein